MEEVMKTCNKCSVEKPLTEYHKKVGKLQPLCKPCAIAYQVEYRKKNKDKVIKAARNYTLNNRNKISLIKKRYYENNKEFILKKVKTHYYKNRETLIEKNKIYHKLNRKKLAIKQNEYDKMKKKNDPIYYIKYICRKRLRNFLKFKNSYKTKSFKEYIGCSAEELKLHLEKQFHNGMTWENKGLYWHIDHIKPLCSGKTEEEIYKLCHYTNLQPLTATENLKKGGKLVY